MIQEGRLGADAIPRWDPVRQNTRATEHSFGLRHEKFRAARPICPVVKAALCDGANANASRADAEKSG
jgi:hypothetical protein